ncbi:CPBP family glutamic-type intramembrane protease [Sphaerimonospora thailandensis]|uniref:CPBP family glutamic-type intramembrane protease n=1 Tax=Sphaerimonospora thailandensis TaxID=795644 RepID=UPI001950829A|nr:hypothetical protein [Sphaerimonospora thailandensis]
MPLFPVLIARLSFFAVAQAGVALALTAAGERDPLAASAAWWPLTAAAANLVTIAMLARLARREGMRLVDLYRSRIPGGIGGDVRALLVVLLLAAPIAYLPNVGLATLLFGDAAVALDMFVQPLPVWAAVAGMVVFPVTIAFAELPTYFGYAMPRLEARWGSAPAAVATAAFFLAIQHVTLPFIADWRFVLWRALMFVPFALLVGVAIRRRPRLLPYLMVVHALIDFAAVQPVFAASV